MIEGDDINILGTCYVITYITNTQSATNTISTQDAGPMQPKR